MSELCHAFGGPQQGAEPCAIAGPGRQRSRCDKGNHAPSHQDAGNGTGMLLAVAGSAATAYLVLRYARWALNSGPLVRLAPPSATSDVCSSTMAHVQKMRNVQDCCNAHFTAPLQEPCKAVQILNVLVKLLCYRHSVSTRAGRGGTAAAPQHNCWIASLQFSGRLMVSQSRCSSKPNTVLTAFDVSCLSIFVQASSPFATSIICTCRFGTAVHAHHGLLQHARYVQLFDTTRHLSPHVMRGP